MKYVLNSLISFPLCKKNAWAWNQLWIIGLPIRIVTLQIQTKQGQVKFSKNNLVIVRLESLNQKIYHSYNNNSSQNWLWSFYYVIGYVKYLVPILSQIISTPQKKYCFVTLCDLPHDHNCLRVGIQTLVCLTPNPMLSWIYYIDKNREKIHN